MLSHVCRLTRHSVLLLLTGGAAAVDNDSSTVATTATTAVLLLLLLLQVAGQRLWAAFARIEGSSGDECCSSIH
jgi:hypothetical protein